MQWPTNLLDPAYGIAVLDAVIAGEYSLTWTPVTSTDGAHTIQFLFSSLPIRVADTFVNVSATLQQQIADVIGALLPTPKMMDLAWLARAATIAPVILPIASTSAAMVQASQKLDAELASQPAGIVMCQKTWAIGNSLLVHSSKAMNYGFFVIPTSGTTYQGIGTEACVSFPTKPQLGRVIQGQGWAHDRSHIDYSQVGWFVNRTCTVDGQQTDMHDVLTDPALAHLVSHEGVLTLPELRQPGVPTLTCMAGVCTPQPVSGEEDSSHFGLLALSGAALALTIGGFLGGLALMGRTTPKPPKMYENPPIHPDFRPLVAAALAQGWSVTPTKGGHIKFQSPQGNVVFAGGTPSDWRASRNLRAQLRRAGLAV